ncbi:MAG: PQQ-like beta-propeller repeat protein [Acidobacteria bacterium]|nr:PQQ-like beta-propeller repeat protein [Acidobacteriota bacterium]
MKSPEIGNSNRERPLRLWPGVAIVILQWVARFVLPELLPRTLQIGILAGLGCGLALVLWWLFFSRAPWSERLGAVGLMAVALVVTPFLLHESVATGAMGMLFFLYVTPPLCLAFVVWAALSHRLEAGPRWGFMAAAIFFACGGWALVKTGGFTADFDSDFSWRWAKTPEERLLARSGEEPTGSEGSLAVAGRAEWPGFRGPRRDGVVNGSRIATDWSQSPPVEVWRRSVGPGWSSFAVSGDFVYTQEQRGEEEAVTCYRASTGEPVWRHSDAARFWESNGGAGPRGTPTLSEGRVYAVGGTGILNVLDAADGRVIWSRNTAEDTGAETPTWGFSGSPLVVEDLVLVAASGRLAAYDRASGEARWSGPTGKTSYSSPHLMTLGGVPQVLQLSGEGLRSFRPSDGMQLWEHLWPGYPIVQPASTGDGDLLIAANESDGIRRLAVSRETGGWSVEERWTSIRLKPYFNDFVVHRGHAYGFDGAILACVDLANGERKWKGGRYGNGQLLLLADQDLLLVLSERGDLALVAARPDGFDELARFPALEGKTWNHPVLNGDLLLVRNAEEMAAFRLARGEG